LLYSISSASVDRLQQVDDYVCRLTFIEYLPEPVFIDILQFSV